MHDGSAPDAPAHGQAGEAFVRELDFSLFIARMALWRCQLRAHMLSLAKAAKPAPRVALSLALVAEAQRSISSHLPSASAGDDLLITIKQAVLAAHTGLSRAVLSLQLQPLVAAGWLSLDYGSLCLLKLPAWRALLQAHMQSGMHTWALWRRANHQPGANVHDRIEARSGQTVRLRYRSLQVGQRGTVGGMPERRLERRK